MTVAFADWASSRSVARLSTQRKLWSSWKPAHMRDAAEACAGAKQATITANTRARRNRCTLISPFVVHCRLSFRQRLDPVAPIGQRAVHSPREGGGPGALLVSRADPPGGERDRAMRARTPGVDTEARARRRNGAQGFAGCPLGRIRDSNPCYRREREVS